jgi:hypothetical protein
VAREGLEVADVFRHFGPANARTSTAARIAHTAFIQRTVHPWSI